MTIATKRLAAAVGSFLVGAAVNVVTGLLTQSWSVAWIACLASLLIVGTVLQAWLTVLDRASVRRQNLDNVEGGSLEQTMDGPGEQIIKRAKVKGKLVQRQGEYRWNPRSSFNRGQDPGDESSD